MTEVDEHADDNAAESAFDWNTDPDWNETHYPHDLRQVREFCNKSGLGLEEVERGGDSLTDIFRLHVPGPFGLSFVVHTPRRRDKRGSTFRELLPSIMHISREVQEAINSHTNCPACATGGFCHFMQGHTRRVSFVKLGASQAASN